MVGTMPGWWRRLTVNSWALLFVVLVVICLFFLFTAPGFGDLTSFDDILVVAVPITLLAMGESLAIYSGGIDLSVGSMMGLGGMVAGAVMANLYRGHTGSDTSALLLGLVAALGVGAVGGLFNGFVIGRFHLNPLIVTLGTLGIFGGAADLISGGQPISSFPSSSFELGNGLIGGVLPILVLAGVIVVAGFLFLERSTRLGRHIFAHGASRDALIRAGVSPNVILLWIYGLAGCAAALAGFFTDAQFQTATPIAGQDTLLLGVAAVVIGGTPLVGGEGTVLGAAIGAILISVLENGFVELGLQSYWQTVAVGALVILAVYVTQQQHRRVTFGYHGMLPGRGGGRSREIKPASEPSPEPGGKSG